VLLLRLDRVDEAVEHLAEAKRLRPDLAAVRHNLAGARVRQGRVDEAMAELGEALRLEPSPDRHFLLGNLLSRQGRFEEAIAEYRAALRMDPNHGGASGRLAAAMGKRAGAGGS
jgi:tetratricopeptide (TPR) repeat protein